MTGIVIVLTNKEKEINAQEIELFLNENTAINICFVNNGSTDRTLTILESLNEKYPKKLSVVNIKNNKGEDAALNVGFRYLLNKRNITKLNFSNHLNFRKMSSFSEFSSKFLING
jgi:glycosyltransferase involved in cell wall biosynthesis